MKWKRRRIREILLLSLLTLGCSSDERLTRLATESANRQARQSEAVTELNQEVAAGAKRLVEAQAEARTAADAERWRLNEGWNLLETERRQIASHRRTESLLAIATRGGTALLVILFCLAIATLALWTGQSEEATSDELVSVLVTQFAEGENESPRLPNAEDHSPRLTHTMRATIADPAAPNK